jgi:integrase
VQRVEHHPALSCDDLAGFVEAIRSRNALSALALEFVILTATRTSETLGARWSEFDLKQAVWTIPAARTKASREHRVPLSARALEILEAVAPLKPGTSDKAKAAYVFPGQRANSGLSSMALLVLLRRMERTDITVHGFRSTFRDWAAERTNFPREVAEMALGHTIGDKVEAAYRRGDLFEKRRKLMEAWAKYCAVADSKIDAGSINSVIS